MKLIFPLILSCFFSLNVGAFTERKLHKFVDSLMISNEINWLEIKTEFETFAKKEFSLKRSFSMNKAMSELISSKKLKKYKFDRSKTRTFRSLLNLSKHSDTIVKGIKSKLKTHLSHSDKWTDFDNLKALYLGLHSIESWTINHYSPREFAGALRFILKDFKNQTLAYKLTMILFVDRMYNGNDSIDDPEVSVVYAEKKEEKDESDDDENFKVMDFAAQDPEFMGGGEGMTFYIQHNIEYPVFSIEMGESGRVYVEFVVNKDGSLTEVKVIRGVSRHLDREAIRTIKSMPNWRPGVLDGENVRVRFTIPIAFNLG